MSDLDTSAFNRGYSEGSRSAWRSILIQALRNLGYENRLDESEKRYVSMVFERESTIARLRDLCEEFGDNDWEDNLSLSSVIENHLARHLWERYEQDSD